MSNKFAVYNSKRTRNWSVIFWVDDLPENWLDKVPKGYKWGLSPLHNKDTWTEDDEKKNPEHKAGAIKKHHHHAIFQFPSQKTRNQMCELFGDIFGYGDETEKSVKGVQFQKCDIMSGSVQYFTHINHPEKYQYNIDDIQAFNGFDVERHLKHEPTQAEVRKMLDDIENIIKYNDITELVDLIEFLQFEEDKTMLDVVRVTHRGHFRDYLASRRGKIFEEKRIQNEFEKRLKELGYRYDSQAKIIFRI